MLKIAGWAALGVGGEGHEQSYHVRRDVRVVEDTVSCTYVHDTVFGANGSQENAIWATFGVCSAGVEYLLLGCPLLFVVPQDKLHAFARHGEHGERFEHIGPTGYVLVQLSERAFAW